MKKAYLRRVGRLLDCSSAERKRLLERLGDAVDAYLTDVPDAGETELVKTFGPPEICAARLLEECDPAVLAELRRRRKRRNWILLTALTVLLALAVGVAVYLWSNSALVIIKTTTYENGFPDDIVWDQIIYAYED